MTIRIVTDSTADIPAETAAELGITVVPVYINIGEKSYLDGIDLSRQEFYRRLPGFNPFPKTSTPGVDAFRSAYERLAEQGASEILSIHVVGAFSALIDSARMAARSTSSVPVTVFDSQTLSLGLGLMVVSAARAAQSGRSMAEILSLLAERSQRTFVYAALDTVEYLRRSGRASRIEAGLATLLHIYPVLSIHQSILTLERVRTRQRSFERLIQIAQEKAPLEELAILHASAPEKAAAVYERISGLVPPGTTIWTAEVTPAIGSHVGPNAVGLVCVTR